MVLQLVPSHRFDTMPQQKQYKRGEEFTKEDKEILESTIELLISLRKANLPFPDNAYELFELCASHCRIKDVDSVVSSASQESDRENEITPVESSAQEEIVNQTPERGPKKPNDSSITVQGDNNICHARVEPHMSAASRDAHPEHVNDVPQPVHHLVQLSLQLPINQPDQLLTSAVRTHLLPRSNRHRPISSLPSNPSHSTSSHLPSSKSRTQLQPINPNPLPFIAHHPPNRIIWLRQSEWPPPFAPPLIVA